jgi:hypothetical protein
MVLAWALTSAEGGYVGLVQSRVMRENVLLGLK